MEKQNNQQEQNTQVTATQTAPETVSVTIEVPRELWEKLDPEATAKDTIADIVLGLLKLRKADTTYLVDFLRGCQEPEYQSDLAYREGVSEILRNSHLTDAIYGQPTEIAKAVVNGLGLDWRVYQNAVTAQAEHIVIPFANDAECEPPCSTDLDDEPVLNPEAIG